MKHSNIHKIVLLLALINLLIYPSFAHANNAYKIAKDNYEKGDYAYRNKNWNDAINYFLVSYQAFSIPQTAYYLSCTYVQLGNSSKAIEFAKRSLSGDPPLEESYRGNAINILNWGNNVTFEIMITTTKGPSDNQYEESKRKALIKFPSPELIIPKKDGFPKQN